MKRRAIWLRFKLACCLLVCSANLVHGAETGSSQEPVQLEAEEVVFDEATNTYLAEREVLLRKGQQQLQADRMRYNDATSVAEAFGNVHFIGPEGELFGDEMSLNVDSGLGEVANGRLYIRESNLYAFGSTISKTGERSYRVEEGTFTTCDGPKPSWKFTAPELDVTLGDYVWAKHLIFHVYDLPVFYTPVFGYPVKTERQSGFLTPSIGYSDERGTELFMSYYQVIAPNLDATFYLDYLSQIGLGKGLEYRYFLGHDNRGALKGYHVNGFDGRDDSIVFDWLHRGTLPGRVRLAADVEYVSNREFFSDFGEAVEEYNKDVAEAVVYANRAWGKNNLTGQVKYVKNLESSNKTTLQRLPEVRFGTIRQRFGQSPFYYDFNSQAVNFWREEGLKGGRLAARPALSAVFRPGGVLEIVPEVGYLERLYTTNEGGAREGIFDFSTLVSTRLARVYPMAGRTLRKVQHVLQPEIVYSYVPSQDQSDLPQFDTVDFISRQSTLGYGFVNRFIGRYELAEGQIDYREFLYLRLAQEYDFEESTRSRLFPWDQDRPFSALRTELIWRPSPSSYVDFDSRYDISGGDQFLTLKLETGLKDQKGNGLSLRYSYAKDKQEYLRTKLDLALLKPVYLSYLNRYSLDGNVNLENVLNLEYRAQCWSFYLTYRNRDGREQEITVNFALAGLGRTVYSGGRRPQF